MSLVDVESAFPLPLSPSSFLVSQIWRAFNLQDDAFSSEFGFAKPPKDSADRPLVLHCLAGKRAVDAADKLALLGYSPRVYKGSFKDWKKKGGEIFKQE